ncbi:hypothetical protein J5I95_02270 [Candidatus Poribacteria bacterium]|nr:hypothetical protein [Candidatus Poribacteria bacterium]
MAFSDFKTISEVQEKFRIMYAEMEHCGNLDGSSVIHLPKTEQISHWLICRHFSVQLILSLKPLLNGG